MGVLAGVKIIEFEGIGPAPFCGMLLADLGAEVILIERPESFYNQISELGSDDILKRGKKSIALDLKNPSSHDVVFDLIKKADGVIEGLRPGVMERLGLGPDDCRGRNPRLVYGRVTGWGQTGPLAQAAGHDINYIGLSGASWYAGKPGDPPFAPPTIIGDVGGGALYLTIGMLSAILNARDTGHGNVVDAAMVDGSAHMMNLILNVVAAKQASFTRGQSVLDGPHWFDAYECADGAFITVGALEPKFYQVLLTTMGLSDDARFASQYDPKLWPEQKTALAEIFASKTQKEWCELLEGTDACFSPSLSPADAAEHPHIQARGSYIAPNGILQGAPAPRFERDSIMHPSPAPLLGEHSDEILQALGYDAEKIAALKEDGAVK